MEGATVDIGLVRSNGRIRAADDAKVKAIADSIAEVGLMNPITVYRCDVIHEGQKRAGFGLIAGLHRLEACKSLGLAEIQVQVADLGEHERTIAECDENLCGTNLSPAEVATFSKRRKEAYERLHPETKHGTNQHTRGEEKSSTPNFADDQAKKTGKTARKVRMDAARGESICEDALAIVRGTSLDKGVYLDRLAKIASGDQVAKVKADLAEQQRKSQETRRAAKIDRDVKARAATEVAEAIAEHVPGEWWDGVKANLYAAGAKNIADALSNITGQSIMDQRGAA